MASFSWQETRVVGLWIQGWDPLFANLKTCLCIPEALIWRGDLVPQGQRISGAQMLAENAGKMTLFHIQAISLFNLAIYRQKEPRDPAKIAAEDVFYRPNSGQKDAPVL